MRNSVPKDGNTIEDCLFLWYRFISQFWLGCLNKLVSLLRDHGVKDTPYQDINQ